MRVGVVGLEQQPHLYASHIPALRSLPLRVEIVEIVDGVDGGAAQAVDASLADGVATVGGSRVVPFALVDDPAWARAKDWAHELDGVVLARMSMLLGGRDGEPSDHAQVDGGGPQSLDGAVVDACSVLVDLFGTVEIEVGGGFAGGVEALVRAPDIAISLTVARLEGGRSERRLELLAPDGRVAIDFASPFLFATPSVVSRTTRAGTELARPIHENGWRGFWRRMHEEWAGGRVESNAPFATKVYELAARLNNLP